VSWSAAKSQSNCEESLLDRAATTARQGAESKIEEFCVLLMIEILAPCAKIFAGFGQGTLDRFAVLAAFCS
jgi:hypothetical protein